MLPVRCTFSISFTLNMIFHSIIAFPFSLLTTRLVSILFTIRSEFITKFLNHFPRVRPSELLFRMNMRSNSHSATFSECTWFKTFDMLELAVSGLLRRLNPNNERCWWWAEIQRRARRMHSISVLHRQGTTQTLNEQPMWGLVSDPSLGSEV